MGKEKGASIEELEFIFNGFIKGLSDREILDSIQGTELPVRNLRFIRDRRRHFDAAKTVLRVQLEKELDPIIIECRKEHFSRLAEVASFLIQGLEDTSLSKEQLSQGLKDNILYIQVEDYNPNYRFFLKHLKIKTDSFEKQAEANPAKLIQTLEVLSLRKTFKGKCDICKDW